MQVGPLAVLSSLLDRNSKETNEPTTSQRKVNRPPDAQQEFYLYQDERFDFVIYDWKPEGDPFFDKDFTDGLSALFSGYVKDPLNEKDHAWAFM